MDPTDIGLFRLAESKLNWIDRRQAVLAQNVANANTPEYKARDLAPFAASLAEQGISLALTSPMDIPGTSSAVTGQDDAGSGTSPNGNTVSMDQQLAKVADTSNAQDLVSNLYHKYQDMFRNVLGVSG